MPIKHLNLLFKKVISKPELKAKLEAFMSVEIKTKNILEAFSFSMKKNYTPVPAGWHEITRYKAHQILSSFIKSKNTFDKYLKAGFFRVTKQGGVYQEEVEKYRDIAAFTETLYDSGVLQESSEFGEKRIVLFPTSVNKLGLGDNLQKTKAGIYVLKEKWFQDWVSKIDFEI